MVEEARAVHAEKRATDEAIGRFGAEFMPAAGKVMTQCNAGALATAGIGTALGVIRVAVEQGHKLHVLVPETRPYLQGARLTAWELHEGGVPLTLITDNMVGHFMKTGTVGAVVVGADRIAANGDTANKIGTYQIAVLAHEHGVPFYVAAPVSTFDLTISSGEQIPIEERSRRRSHPPARRAHRPRRGRGEPRFRRHAGAPRHRNHLRTRRGPRAVHRVAAPAGGIRCNRNTRIVPIALPSPDQPFSPNSPSGNFQRWPHDSHFHSRQCTGMGKPTVNIPA